jgi:predicted nucleic acid-binding protein
MSKIYIETSIVSYLTARPSNNLIAAAWQKETIDWWETQKDRFDLFISEVVIEEASRGDETASARRLAALEDIKVLQLNEKSVALSKALIAEGGMAKKALEDALHVAISAVEEVDFLLTWNCKHINNAEMKPNIRKIIEAHGYRCPEIATPIKLRGVDKMTDEILKELWEIKESIAKEHGNSIDGLAEYYLRKQSIRNDRLHRKEREEKADGDREKPHGSPSHTIARTGP